MHTTILTLPDLRAIIGHVGFDALMDEAIDGIEYACREYDEQRFDIPPRGGLAYEQPNLGLLEWMPALETGQRSTIKLVGYHPTNPTLRQLPTILSVALSFETDSGHLSAVVDGVFPTALRTGAASAVASRVLASPGSAVLGLIGCGAQALTQLHALSRVFDLKRVLVYDSDPTVGQGFAHRAAPLQLRGVELLSKPLDQVVASADILCTATSIDIGKGPVFADRGTKAWVHVNAVGSDFPGKTELPVGLLQRALVCPDFAAQALAEGESQQLTEEALGPSLPVLVKNADEYQAWQQRTTVFDSTGWALEDHVIVDILVRHAHRLGCGTEVQLESVSSDPRNPYGFAFEQGNRRAAAAGS